MNNPVRSRNDMIFLNHSTLHLFRYFCTSNGLVSLDYLRYGESYEGACDYDYCDASLRQGSAGFGHENF